MFGRVASNYSEGSKNRERALKAASWAPYQYSKLKASHGELEQKKAASFIISCTNLLGWAQKAYASRKSMSFVLLVHPISS